jgi:hypothetical protein
MQLAHFLGELVDRETAVLSNLIVKHDLRSVRFWRENSEELQRVRGYIIYGVLFVRFWRVNSRVELQKVRLRGYYYNLRSSYAAGGKTRRNFIYGVRTLLEGELARGIAEGERS